MASDDDIIHTPLVQHTFTAPGPRIGRSAAAYSILDAIADSDAEDARPSQRAAGQHLQSALSVIVREAAIDLGEFGGQWYVPKHTNPFPSEMA